MAICFTCGTDTQSTAKICEICKSSKGMPLQVVQAGRASTESLNAQLRKPALGERWLTLAILIGAAALVLVGLTGLIVFEDQRFARPVIIGLISFGFLCYSFLQMSPKVVWIAFHDRHDFEESFSRASDRIGFRLTSATSRGLDFERKIALALRLKVTKSIFLVDFIEDNLAAVSSSRHFIRKLERQLTAERVGAKERNRQNELMVSATVLLLTVLSWWAFRWKPNGEPTTSARIVHQAPLSNNGGGYVHATTEYSKGLQAAAGNAAPANATPLAQISRVEKAKAQEQRLNQRDEPLHNDVLSHDEGTGTVDVEVYRAGGDISSPTLISNVEPEYSEEARRARYSGVVRLSAVIDEHGIPTNICVTTPLGLGLDEKAIKAVQRWRFQPGAREGKPVKVRVSLAVTFTML